MYLAVTEEYDFLTERSKPCIFNHFYFSMLVPGTILSGTMLVPGTILSIQFGADLADLSLPTVSCKLL